MHSNSSSITGRLQSVPCAVKDYMNKGGSIVSQQDCQIAFQHWVAYVRNNTSHTPIKQPGACPLSYCEKIFDNFESLLQHVSVCSWLSNGWYWCSICLRHEKFTPPIPEGEQESRLWTQKKETRLKRAVAFFKHFGGCRSFSRSHNPGLPYKSKTIHRWHIHRRMRDEHEMEAHPRISWMPELDEQDCGSTDVKAVEHADYKEATICAIRKGIQTDVTPSKTQPELKRPTSISVPVELCGSNPPCYELLGTDLDMPELSAEGQNISPSEFSMDLDEQVLGDLVSPLSPTLTIRESTFTPLSDLVSPISPIGSGFVLDLFNPISSVESALPQNIPGPISPIESSWAQGSIESRLRRPILSIVTNTESLTARRPSRIVNNAESLPTRRTSRIAVDNEAGPTQCQGLSVSRSIPTQTANLASGCGMGPFSKNGLPNSETLVKDTNAIVCALHEYWLQKLSSLYGVPVIQDLLQASSPVETGLKALQGCFRGVLPTTFAEIFSLTELAFACAYLFYEDDDKYSWHGFFQDILQMRHAIVNEEDKQLFSKIALSIWSPPEMPVVRQGAAYSKQPLLAPFSAQTHSGFNPEKTAWTLRGNVNSFTLDQFREPDFSARTPSASKTLDALRKGRVTGVCSRYLDALEYVGIADWNGDCSVHSPLNSPRSVAQIQEQIIVPLIRLPAMKGFCDAIMTTTIDLSDGVLRNVREVEINLALNGGRCHQPRQAYEGFLTLVASLCDNFMSQSSPSWRDRCYATDLDGVRAICLELKKEQHQMLPPIVQVHDAPTHLSPDDSHLETPISGTSIEDPSPISSASATSASGFSSCPSSSTSGTSTQLSSPSNSPLGPLPSPSIGSPTSPLPIIPTLYCSTCGQAFKGAYRMTNRRRHTRNTHIRRTKYLCPEPYCGIECSRTDNLRKHRRVVHGLSDKREKQSAGKQI